MSFFLQEDEQILELESRRTIYQVVQKYSGSYLREIQRKSQLSLGSTKYHLHFLTKKGLIKTKQDGQHLRYFPAYEKDQHTLLLSCLRKKPVRSILLCIHLHKNCIQEDIVKEVGLSAPTVSFHLHKLLEAQLVTSAKTGRKTHYTLNIDATELMNLLITYKESFVDTLVNKVIDMWDFE